MDEDKHIFTEADVTNSWEYYLNHFVEILNGEYSIEEAREDLLEIIKYNNLKDM